MLWLQRLLPPQLSMLLLQQQGRQCSLLESGVPKSFKHPQLLQQFTPSAAKHLPPVKQAHPQK